MSVSELLLILRARLLLALCVVIFVVAATVTISLVLPKQYVATATVLADIKADPVTANNVITAELPANYIATQVDVVGSDRVALHAVEMLDLVHEARFTQLWQTAAHGQGDQKLWLAQYLRRHLEVTPSRESNVISISFQWTNPEDAARFANAFAQSYIEVSVELKVAPAKQYTDWFSQRAQALGADLADKQTRLADFEREHGIVGTDERLDVEALRLNELSTQLVQVQTQRQESQSRKRHSGRPDMMPEVVQNPVVAMLKEQLSAAETKLGNLRNQLGESHPDYIRAQADVADLHARIAQESATIAGSIGTTAAVDEQRENALRAAVEEQKSRLLEMKHQRDQAAILENDVQTAQRALDAVNQRLAQTSLESAVQQTTVVMLTPATPPFRHSSPKVTSNTIVAVFLGTILGIALALFLERRDRRVRNIEDLVRSMDLPVLGRIRTATALLVGSSMGVAENVPRLALSPQNGE
jgi:chain length determinant protein EpsF